MNLLDKHSSCSGKFYGKVFTRFKGCLIEFSFFNFLIIYLDVPFQTIGSDTLEVHVSGSSNFLMAFVLSSTLIASISPLHRFAAIM